MKGWVLVTGAGRRIGRAITLNLAEDGWDIIIHYNRSAADAETLADEILEMGRQALLAEIDLAQGAPLAKLIPSLAAELGHITALVNNASLFETDDKDATGTLHKAINAEAPRILSEALYKQLPANAAGCIVNLLDAVPPEKNFDAYKASKEMLKATTLAMAKDYAPRLRVNGVAPGLTLPSARQSDANFQTHVDATLLKTPVAPEEVAEAVRFLLASPTITGEILHVDAGMHLQG